MPLDPLEEKMNDKRPVNLDLSTVSFPITAIVSILHRITAVITWVGLGFLLVLLGYALGSEQQYMSTSQVMQNNFLLQFVTWGFLTALAYYCLASAKHIIQDLGFCENFESGSVLSWGAIIIGVLFAMLAGVFVWA
jgi:succinate dehydrogenase / fumarate reductase cytochrome b subunit